MSGIKGNHLEQGLWPMEQNSLLGNIAGFFLWPFSVVFIYIGSYAFMNCHIFFRQIIIIFIIRGKSVSVYQLQKAGITAGGVLS